MKPRSFGYTIAFMITAFVVAYGIANRNASDGTVNGSGARMNTFAGTSVVHPGEAMPAQTVMAAAAPQPRTPAAVPADEDAHGDDMPGAPHTDDDLLGILFSADYEPAYDEQGAFRGMRIAALPEDGFATAPPGKQLQNGDIITRINDVALVDANSLAAAIRQFYWLEGRAVVLFVVERDGTTHSVPLELRH